MIERTRAVSYRPGWRETSVTPAEYRFLYAKKKRRWKFKPKSAWPFLVWGFILFMAFRMLLIPMVEGIYNYFAKTQELHALQKQSAALDQQIRILHEDKKYKETDAYALARSRELNYIKPNESHILVIEPSKDGTPYQPNQRKSINQITD